MRLNTSNHLQVLDYVLENTFHNRDYWDVKNFFCNNNETFPENDEYFLKMALNKIQKDGYIDFIAGERYVTGQQAGEGISIRRNFAGHLFLNDGGYIGEENRRIAEAQTRNDYQERAETLATDLRDWTRILAVRTNELKNWTMAVAIGAIGLVAWEIFHALFLEKHP
jgi:hypothetical protein